LERESGTQIISHQNTAMLAVADAWYMFSFVSFIDLVEWSYDKQI
jgi:hypothetical protein